MPFLTDGALVMALAISRSLGDGSEILEALIALHESANLDAASQRAAANAMQSELTRLQARATPSALQGRERQILRELLACGAEGNFLDYASAEQAFMAVQMLVYEIGDARLQAELDPLGDSLDDDERYRPARFAALLAAPE